MEVRVLPRAVRLRRRVEQLPNIRLKLAGLSLLKELEWLLAGLSLLKELEWLCPGGHELSFNDHVPCGHGARSLSAGR